MSKKYKLLKDLPDSKAGDVYVLCDDDKEWPSVYYKNGNQEESYWLPEHVVNSPDWFEEVKSENKTTDSFQWTDELIRELLYARFPIAEHYFGSLQSVLNEFKASKTNSTKEDKYVQWDIPMNARLSQPKPQAENKDWEIESYINTTNDEIFTLASVWNNTYYREGFKDYTKGFKAQDCFKIHSVKRLSDNEVFTVNEITDGDNEIHAFQLTGSILSVHMRTPDNPVQGWLTNIQSLVKKQPHKDKQERIEVTVIGEDIAGWSTTIRPNNQFHVIPKSKHPAIKQVIEGVLNDDKGNGLVADILGNPQYAYPPKIYSEKELLDAEEKAFLSSRNGIWSNQLRGAQYPTFSDYKNNI